MEIHNVFVCGSIYMYCTRYIYCIHINCIDVYNMHVFIVVICDIQYLDMRKLYMIGIWSVYDPYMIRMCVSICVFGACLYLSRSSTSPSSAKTKRWAASVVPCAEHVQGCATRHGLWQGRGPRASKSVKTAVFGFQWEEWEEDQV